MAEKMTMNKAISKIMKDNGFTQMMMAQAIGKKRPNDISSRLQYDNMTISKSLEMLEVLGYEITIQPKRPGARPKGQIVIISSADKSGAASEDGEER